MTPTSMSLSWVKPEENGCQLKYYIIEYDNYGEKIEKIIPYSDDCEVTIDNLKENQQYKFNLMTENIFGERSVGSMSTNLKTGRNIICKSAIKDHVCVINKKLRPG